MSMRAARVIPETSRPLMIHNVSQSTKTCKHYVNTVKLDRLESSFEQVQEGTRFPKVMIELLTLKNQEKTVSYCLKEVESKLVERDHSQWMSVGHFDFQDFYPLPTEMSEKHVHSAMNFR